MKFAAALTYLAPHELGDVGVHVDEADQLSKAVKNGGDASPVPKGLTCAFAHMWVAFTGASPL